MSALLPLKATELNILAEYGYSYRRFYKYPYVCSPINATSTLFLVHHQNEPIPNRIRNYRNHFVLYTSIDCIVVARTETTLILTDNDAIINYDIIKPLPDVGDRFRAKCSTWDVSFDRMVYSSEKPSNLSNFEMLCNGEWWYYDKGIILNGQTRYENNKPTRSIFIYYEFHTKCNVRMPNKQAIMPMNPYIGIQQPPSEQSTMAMTTTTTTTTNPPPPTTTLPTETFDEYNNRKNLSTTTNTLPVERLTSFDLYNQSMRLNSGGDILPQLPITKDSLAQNILNLATAAAAANSNNLSSISFILPPQPRQNSPFIITTQQQKTLHPSILPYANSTPRRTENDLVQIPEIQYEAIIPSLYWFETRSEELRSGDITQFLPIDYDCAQNFTLSPHSIYFQ